MSGTLDKFELLRGLWEGDEDSYGYQHPNLVIEACRYCPDYTEPGPQWVLNHLRAGFVKVSEADPEELEIINRGIQIWTDLGKPRTKLLQGAEQKELAGGS